MFIIILLYFISCFYQITFYKKDETYNILKNNKTFYDKFMKIDLDVRNVNNINEYIKNIKDDVCDFSLYDKIRLFKCCKIANDNIYKKKYDWFDGKKAYNIKWKFGCVKKYYEKGFPHTVNGKVIILSKLILNTYTDAELIRTLIHEKTHLYQKKYKDDIKIYLNKNKIVYYKNREDSDNIRVNPDTDNLIYKDKDDNFYYGAKFNNNPSNLNDVYYYNNNSRYEHPYEQMAYEISSLD
jgi:hypothetical protein